MTYPDIGKKKLGDRRFLQLSHLPPSQCVLPPKCHQILYHRNNNQHHHHYQTNHHRPDDYQQPVWLRMSANHSTLLKSGESGDFQHLIYILKILFDINWKYYLRWIYILWIICCPPRRASTVCLLLPPTWLFWNITRFFKTYFGCVLILRHAIRQGYGHVCLFLRDCVYDW